MTDYPAYKISKGVHALASWITIILFFIYTYGLGFTITSFLNESKNAFERIVMRVGLGISAFIVLGAAINFLRLPIDWRIFLAASLIYPSIWLIRNSGKISLPTLDKIKLTKSNIYSALAILIFAATFFMYASGAFSYPYFEDDDPWTHAIGVKYIAVEKDLFAPKGGYVTNFLDPYPPGYEMMMGVLHQTSPSINWTMKFFNALLISLCLLFFYLFVMRFSESKRIALASTFILASIPCFLSHFIWAHALIPALFFIALYSLEMMDGGRKWKYVAGIAIASIMLTHPSQSIKFAFFLGAYWLIRTLAHKKVHWDSLVAGAVGAAISLLWWVPVLIRRNGLSGVSEVQLAGSSGTSFLDGIGTFFSPTGGSATRAYSFSDFFVARTNNMINNPIGIGIAICILAIVGLVIAAVKYRQLLDSKNKWLAITLLWLAFTFLGVNSATFHLPVGLFAFRFWMLLAIPVSILAGYGLVALADSLKNVGIPKAVTVVAIIALVILTSTYPKFVYNRAQWPPGVGWTSYDELAGFTQLYSLPANTGVFSLSSGAYVLGFDKYICQWCDDVKSLQKTAYSLPPEQLASSLKAKGYEYMIISTRDTQELGVNETNIFVGRMADSKLFEPVMQNGAVMLFKVN